MRFVYVLTLLLPIVFAALLLSKAGKTSWRMFTCAGVGIEAILTIAVAVCTKTGVTMFTLLGLPFVLAPDVTGCIFAVLFSVLFFASGVFAAEYLDRDHAPGEFGAVYVLTLGAMIGLCWAGNLQTYYMFFECLTLASFPLVLHERSMEARKAAEKYLCYSLLGASLVLFGMIYIQKLLGTLTFTPGGYEIAGADTKLALAIAFVTIMGFGCKAGIMPLHNWLPTAHPVAPAPASAILSGTVTKAGVLGIMRVAYFLFGAESLRGTWVQTVLIVVALVTVFCGSMLAYRTRILKKRLAYSTVSQVSYALFGLFLFTEAGFVGAMLQVLFHAVCKVCLFLCSGSVIHHSGQDHIYSEQGQFNYYGLGKVMPWTMVGYTLASLSLVGLPPFGGFVGKEYLAEGSFAALGHSGWIGAAVLLVSALLTAGYLLSISANAFFPKPGAPTVKAHEATWRMTVPIMFLACLLAVLGVCSFGYSDMIFGLAEILV